MFARFLKFLGAASLLGLLVAAPLLRYAKTWLMTEVPLPHADWIVVLGGESGQRVIGAAELYHQGIAPRVFITGTGDCYVIEQRLRMAGVPGDAIDKECVSRNTRQNALFTRRALAAQNPQRIMLVTSWTHSYRAMNTFRQLWPDVEFGMHSVYAGDNLRNTLVVYEAGSVLAEYVKNALDYLRIPNAAQASGQ